MRIGELDDAVGKQFLARRESLTGDLARMGAKLADPGRGAVAPAADVPDSVVLSAEARAAHLPPNLAGLPLPPFPSPLQLIAVLKELQAAASPEARRAAAEQLAQLVVRLARSLPPGAPAPPGDNPLTARLVRTLLGGGSPDDVRALVRQLVAASTVQATSPATMAPTNYERAAVAIVTAAMQLRAEVASPPAGTAGQQFPAALLGLIGGPAAPRGRRRHKRRPEADGEAFEDDEDYRRDSRRT